MYTLNDSYYLMKYYRNKVIGKRVADNKDSTINSLGIVKVHQQADDSEEMYQVVAYGRKTNGVNDYWLIEQAAAALQLSHPDLVLKNQERLPYHEL